MIQYFAIIISGLYFIVFLLCYAYVVLQKKKLYTIARLSVFFPLSLQLILIIVHSLNKGRALLSSVSDVMFILSFLIALVYIIIDMKFQKAVFGLFLLPIVIILHTLSFISVTETRLESTVFSYPVFNFHTIFTVSGYASLLISIIVSTMYLYLIYDLKKKRFDPVFYNSPSLEILDRLAIVFQLIGIICLVMGIISGIRLTFLLWGNFPALDPKIIITFILLFYYVFGIVVRFLWKVSPGKLNILSVSGFIIIIFLFFAVNTLFVSRHNWG